jgi:LAO/AO transport system kinase
MRAVAQAITAIENRDPAAVNLLKRLFSHTGRAALIGVTGAPGSGKSTLVDALTAVLRKQGRSVGILAVDPTSPFTGGAILGDRVRMQTHSSDPSVYIRSMATRGALGGLAAATLDAALILDASGKEFILMETVGVGQDEVEVAKIADMTLLLLVPGMGDDVQAGKAGVMEIADLFVLNKSDYPGADRLEEEIRGSMNLAPSPAPWQPPIVRTVATQAVGIEELALAISKYLDFARDTGALRQRRERYWQDRILAIVRDHLLELLLPKQLGSNSLAESAAAAAARQADPYSAAEQILDAAGQPVALPAFGTKLVLDHLGVAVRSLEEAVSFYEAAMGLRVSSYETIPQEKTRVAMIPLGDTRIELLEATEPDSPIARFLAKRGPGLHHICLRVPDLSVATARLRARGARLVNEEPGIGARGHRYVFIHPSTAGGVLFELVEASEPRPVLRSLGEGRPQGRGHLSSSSTPDS